MLGPRSIFVACVLVACAGCSVPVASGLDEGEANRVVVALDRDGIAGEKTIDPAAEGKFRVEVSHDDGARALATLADEQLPRPKPQGMLAATDRGQLVPSQATEQARLVAGLAGELERSLEDVDGVLSARVHLNLPPPDTFRDEPGPVRTASVLLEHRGTTPPLTMEAIQRLVAGGAPGLAPANIAVVFVAHPARPASRAPELVHVGPIAVARSSTNTLRVVLSALVLAILALASLALALYAKLARTRRSPAEGTEPAMRFVAPSTDAHGGQHRPHTGMPAQRAPGPISMRPPAP